MHLTLFCNWDCSWLLLIMQNQELLLLQILKFPVIVIKFLARLLSILTYLPNYAILFLIDSVLFSEALQSTLRIYVLTWLPKVVLLSTVISLFVGEFYIIFQLMHLHEHSLVIQIVGMILTIAGLIILMRKGYLSLLKKYNLTKLKSPLEHAELGILYIIDILGVALWVINAALIINIGRSWDYEYDAAGRYRFIKHIFNLIRQSMIVYIEFFYVKIFFKMFPWRFLIEINTYKKQKQEKNVLNCLVLLTLIYLMTLLDLLIVVLFGIPCLLHHKRKEYIKSMDQSHEKYKITLKQFWFVLLHTIQLLFILICTIFCWSNGAKSLKKWVSFSKVNELFAQQFWSLVMQALLKIPYLLSILFIMMSVYKFKRRSWLLRQLAAKAEQGKKEQYDNDKMWITFTCVGQLIVDMPFVILVVLATLVKPWNIWWLKEILNQKYEMQRSLIAQYLFKAIIQIFIIPCALITSFLISLYEFQRLYGIFQQAGKEVFEEFNLTSINLSAAPQLQKKKQFILRGKSQLGRYLKKTCTCLKEDIPHLPLLCLAQMTFLNLYYPEVKPKTTPDLYITLQRSYYYSTACKSIRYQEYKQMFQRIKASGGLTNIKEQYRFWKFAYKSQRLMLVQKILSFFLPKRSVERILKRIEMGTQLSEISNFYWYHNELTKAMAVRLVFLIIEAILTLIGILVLFPLTLWRIPTFIKLYSYHKSRKFFFPILKRIYIQMVRDVITLPIKIITFLLAPRAYIMFIMKTSFKYGPSGVETFQTYQRCKINYLIRYVLHASWVIILLQYKIIFITIFWIRIRNLKLMLRTQKHSIYTVFTQIVFCKIDVPSMDEMITEAIEDRYRILTSINQLVTTVYHESLQDLPYLLLMVFIFVTMPWRINYLIQTVRDMRQDSQERKSFFKLLRNIFKDYACIFLNILLLVSGFKTKKALFLIKRNYRLNFFIGFLEYSYFQQLKKEMISLGIIYKNMFFLVVAILFGWTRTGQIIGELQLLQKKKRQEQQSALSNKKLYENTVKSGKQLQTLHKMGYYNYITVCSFLTVPEIIKLRQVDQFNYMMTQRQQIWFVKWQYIYSKISNEISQSFEVKCKKAYIKLKNENAGEVVTYEDIIMKYFCKNVFEENVDLAVYLREKMPIKYYDMIFKNYNYQVHQGYGPENELPQEQNQDQEFLRLTNQVRRPQVYLDQNKALFHLFYVRSNEIIVQKVHRFFREDTHRRLKQLSLILGSFSILSIYISSIWLLKEVIFCIDSLIGIKILMIIHFHSYVYLLLSRCAYLHPTWMSLIPFDLYYDFIRFKNFIIEQVKNKIVLPTKRFLVKCWKIIIDIGVKILIKLAEKGNQLYQKMTALGLKIKRGGQKVKDFTVKYSILAYQKVVKPLYISIADKIRKLKNLIIHFFTVVIASIKSVLLFIGRLITSFYEAIRSLLRHINNLYFFILKSCMEFLLKFGLLGNLVFTLLGLVIMTLPSLIWFTLYRERWYLVVSTIHTMVLIVAGYKHLNKIKDGKRGQRKQD